MPPSWPAGILAVLPLHINASQIIRYWSLIYLLGALYAGALLRAMSSDRRRDHLMALLWLLLGTLTHPTFAITAVGMTMAAHLVANDGRIRLAAAHAVGLAPHVDAGGGHPARVLRRPVALLHDGAAGRARRRVRRSA